TLFLFLSSVIFFLELVYLPNNWLIQLLEYTNSCWSFILDWEQTSWLKGFIKPSPLILVFIPLSAFFTIHYKYTHKPTRNIISLGCLFIIIYCGLTYLQKPSQVIHTLPCRKKEITLIYQNNQTVFIDPGTLAGHSALQSWLSYTLIPYLIGSTGKLIIDHAIILQPSARVFEALALLCTKVEIKNFYLPWWENQMPKNAWHHFFAFQRAVKETGCTLVRLNKKKITLKFDEHNFIHLNPQNEYLQYNTATYPVVQVEGIIDKQPFHLYPNQANKKNKVLL
ncbi:MAG: hypothetical protein WCD44_04405, partial [Candidatus Babeliales bacterium]